MVNESIKDDWEFVGFPARQTFPIQMWYMQWGDLRKRCSRHCGTYRNDFTHERNIGTIFAAHRAVDDTGRVGSDISDWVARHAQDGRDGMRDRFG